MNLNNIQKKLIKIILLMLMSVHINNQNAYDYTVDYDVNIIKNESRFHGQIYFNNSGNYSAKEVKNFKYKETIGTHQHVQIHISRDVPIQSLRLDPLVGLGVIEISNFIITSKYYNHKVDFNTINNQSLMQDIKIKDKNLTSVLLHCIGNDPYIELTNHIPINKMNISYLSNVIKLFLFLFLFLEFYLFIITKVPYHYLVMGILYIYSFYAILFSTWDLAYTLLFIFVIASLLLSIYNDVNVSRQYLHTVGIFLTLYLGMSYLGIFIDRPLANFEYLNSKSLLIIASTLIPISFYKIKQFDYFTFKHALSFLLIILSSFIILLNSDIITIHGITFYDIELRRDNWTQKNYSFWYIFLFFTTLSFYTLKKDFIIILLMTGVASYTLFTGYSQSAKLAFSIGIMVYVLMSFIHIKKSYLLMFTWILTLYIIFTPIILSYIDLTHYHERLVSRDAIYKTASSLIEVHWLLGYGFGSTLSIHIKDFVEAVNFPIHYVNFFQGGHPHNLSLLFWLEFGIIGALFLGYYIHKLLVFVINNTYNYSNQPALFGMIIAFEIITSFSWSIWYPQVLLTFSFFGSMLVLSMNIRTLK